MPDKNSNSWSLLLDRLQHHARGGPREIAIILGCGISYDCRLPLWSTFTERLLDYAKIDARSLQSLGLSYPAKISIAHARHITEGKTQEEWTDVVRESLYKDFLELLRKEGLHDFDLDNKTKHAGMHTYLKRKNPALASVVELCASERNVNGSKVYELTPRIGAILTYNYDSLVQYYDRARHGSPRITRTIERASKERHPQKINLYHLHGYLLPKKRDTRDEAPDRIVLTESDYNRREDDAYDFANSSLLWALREFVCIFIGSSMTDELLRRALFRSLQERKSATRAQGYGADNLVRHFAIFRSEEPQINALRYEDLHSLGVNPIWIDDYAADIPTLFARIKDVLVSN